MLHQKVAIKTGRMGDEVLCEPAVLPCCFILSIVQCAISAIAGSAEEMHTLDSSCTKPRQYSETHGKHGVLQTRQEACLAA